MLNRQRSPSKGALHGTATSGAILPGSGGGAGSCSGSGSARSSRCRMARRPSVTR